jgi:hypothetical protein
MQKEGTNNQSVLHSLRYGGEIIELVSQFYIKKSNLASNWGN